jgi:hypothetical protein
MGKSWANYGKYGETHGKKTLEMEDFHGKS